MRKLIFALLFITLFAVSCTDENESIFDHSEPTLQSDDTSVNGGNDDDDDETAGPGSN